MQGFCATTKGYWARTPFSVGEQSEKLRRSATPLPLLRIGIHRSRLNDDDDREEHGFQLPFVSNCEIVRAL
jgi:hypothetical protein